MGIVVIRADIHERFRAIMARALAHADAEMATHLRAKPADDYEQTALGLTPSLKTRRCPVDEHYAAHPGDRFFRRAVPEVHAEHYSREDRGDEWYYRLGRPYLPREIAPWVTNGDTDEDDG